MNRTLVTALPALKASTSRAGLACTCSAPRRAFTSSPASAFASSSTRPSHDNPLVSFPVTRLHVLCLSPVLPADSAPTGGSARQGLPMNNAPPTMPRMQRGLPQKRKLAGVKKIVVVSSGKGGVGKSTVSGECAGVRWSIHREKRRLMDPGLVAVNLALGLANLPDKPAVGLLDLDIFGPSIPKLMALEDMGEPFLTTGTPSDLPPPPPVSLSILQPHRLAADLPPLAIATAERPAENRLVPLKSHGIPCMSMGFLLPPAPPSADGTPGSSADTPVVWRGMMVMKAVQQLLFDVDWRAGTGGQDLDVLVIDMPPGTGDVALSLGQLVVVDGKPLLSCAEAEHI